MSFMDLIRRTDNLDKAFDELQSEMADAFDESFALDGLSPSKAGEPDKPKADAEPSMTASGTDQKPADAEQEQEPAASEQEIAIVAKEGEATGRRLTSHTQSRLAALESFETLYREAQDHLEQIDAKLSEVTTSHQLTRRFYNILRTDIHRANEIEIANLALVAEQKKLAEQLGEATRKNQEREGVIETLRQRETHLSQDNEALRTALAAARLELVEAANASARNEAKYGELLTTLSARTVEAERGARENELLREKQVTLSIDLDKAVKREVEALRRLDELSMLHAAETARSSELMAALGKSEKETVRLQMALESAQMKHAEMAEAALIVEADRESDAARNAAEMRGVRSEIQALQARLDAATSQQSEAAAEYARLRGQLNDAAAEKQVADERIEELLKEHERVQANLSAANANISQLTLRQETEQIQLDIHKQECEDLRAEIAALNARIRDLLPFERLYRVTKARQAEAEPEGGAGSAMPEGSASVMAEATEAAVVRSRAPARRTPGSGRSRAGGGS